MSVDSDHAWSADAWILADRISVSERCHPPLGVRERCGHGPAYVEPGFGSVGL